jgi:hypothetical protein
MAKSFNLKYLSKKKFKASRPEDRVLKTKKEKEDNHYKILSEQKYNFVLSFGKYKGLGAQEVANKDPAYLVWLIEDDIIKDSHVRKLFKMWYNWSKDKLNLETINNIEVK